MRKKSQTTRTRQTTHSQPWVDRRKQYEAANEETNPCRFRITSRRHACSPDLHRCGEAERDRRTRVAPPTPLAPRNDGKMRRHSGSFELGGVKTTQGREHSRRCAGRAPTMFIYTSASSPSRITIRSLRSVASFNERVDAGDRV